MTDEPVAASPAFSEIRPVAEAAGLEQRPCRYVMRPPLALERLGGGLVVLSFLNIGTD